MSHDSSVKHQLQTDRQGFTS